MENNGSDSSSTFNCSVFHSWDYVKVAIVSSASASLSVLCCLAVIMLIFLLKKHYFFIQRLVLYLSLAALFNSLSIVARLYRIGLHEKPDDEVLKDICKIAAFVDQTTMCSQFMAFSVITFTLLMRAVFRRNTSRLEPLYFILIFFFPVAFNWIPFLHHTYGEAGAWCWIRAVNYDDNCSEHVFGTYLRFVLWYVPSYILLISMMLAYLFIVISVTRQKHRWTGRYDPEAIKIREQMRNEVWPLLFYPIGLFVLNIFPLINRIQDSIHDSQPIYVLWLLHAIFSPLQGGYIAMVFTLDRETRRRLTFSNLSAIIFGDGGTVKDYPVGSGLRDSVSEATAEAHHEVYGDIFDEKEPLLKNSSRKETYSKM